jgi:NAD(P)-dependent dehydrogenase (short-subunit alcohol dehydrogenase family)
VSGERLAGKVAIITGAARGQGAAEAELFAQEGASVVFGDILEDEGKAVEAHISEAGYTATFVRLDVTSEDDWAAAVRTAVERYGRLDILVNNAGLLTLETTEEVTKAQWDRVMDVNAWSVVLGTRAVVPEMRKVGGGSIVNISSLSAMKAMPWAAAYHASKGASRIHTKVAAVEYGKYKIRVNSIHPGAVDTVMINDAYSEDFLSGVADRVPLGRMGTPMDIAKGALFLASDDSDYITGTELIIDGGIYAS